MHKAMIPYHCLMYRGTRQAASRPIGRGMIMKGYQMYWLLKMSRQQNFNKSNGIH